MTVTVRRLGVLGGLSRSSTIRCHQMLNREVLKLTGNRAAADLVTWSLDPDTIIRLLSAEGPPTIARQIEEATANLLLEGIDGLMIASDTIHCALEQDPIHLAVPVIQIRDALADELRRWPLERIGFIGTSVTMSSAYYRDLIAGADGVDVVLPSQSLWVNIDYSICNRIYNGESTVLEIETYNQIMSEFEAQNVDMIVVASPEIALAFNKPKPIAVLHTVEICAAAAARWCVADRDTARSTIPLYDEVRRASPGSGNAPASDLSTIRFKKPKRGAFFDRRKGKAGASSRASKASSGGQRPSGS
ncbi:aspartate/glutamate racemase family protein [Methylobacterium sp. J-026]|uniref:aspartate/glutamate racemase family protein n=1 Tax=Methylobacterium sp. J-026 TaxID=2836624 RepID=UPI001FB9468D|nr:aspartate/glutamate racemase family protein [Methylobacterium sp. J-026]MCJ2134530.1 aspartate/glutamate racemase family protein [Methylobacterium sp. J-026]